MMPEAAETIVPMRTTVVAIISLKLSMAVAFIATEPIREPMLRLYRAI